MVPPRPVCGTLCDAHARVHVPRRSDAGGCQVGDEHPGGAAPTVASSLRRRGLSAGGATRVLANRRNAASSSWNNRRFSRTDWASRVAASSMNSVRSFPSASAARSISARRASSVRRLMTRVRAVAMYIRCRHTHRVGRSCVRTRPDGGPTLTSRLRISGQPTLELAFSRFDNLRSADRPIYDRACPAPTRSFPGTWRLASARHSPTLPQC